MRICFTSHLRLHCFTYFGVLFRKSFKGRRLNFFILLEFWNKRINRIILLLTFILFSCWSVNGTDCVLKLQDYFENALSLRQCPLSVILWTKTRTCFKDILFFHTSLSFTNNSNSCHRLLVVEVLKRSSHLEHPVVYILHVS